MTEDRIIKLARRAGWEFAVHQSHFRINQTAADVGVWQITFIPSKIDVSINLHDFNNDDQIIAEIVRQFDLART